MPTSIKEGVPFYQEIPADLPTPFALHGNEDLLEVYGLKHMFDKFVRPYTPALGENPDLLDKTYTPYIQDLPGKPQVTSTRHLRDLLHQPLPNAVPIEPIDLNALRDAFTLQPGAVPDFDPSILGQALKSQAKPRPRQNAPVPKPRLSIKLKFGPQAPASIIKQEDESKDKKKKRKGDDVGGLTEKRPKKRKGSQTSPTSSIEASSDIDILN